MAIGAKTSCIWSFVMFALIPTDDICCVWFMYAVLCWFCCLEVGSSSVHWANSVGFYWGLRQSYSF
jgi:hypothetical protein